MSKFKLPGAHSPITTHELLPKASLGTLSQEQGQQHPQHPCTVPQPLLKRPEWRTPADPQGHVSPGLRRGSRLQGPSPLAASLPPPLGLPWCLNRGCLMQLPP